MARIVSATFQGVPPRDVVSDASIFQRTIARAVGDEGLAYDLATGEHSTTPVAHTGAGDGCPLRMPLAAQWIDADIAVGGTIVDEEWSIITVPVFVRPGEAGLYRLRVTASSFGGIGLSAEVRDSSWALTWGSVDGVAPQVTNDPGSDGVRAIRNTQDVTWEWTPLLAEGLQYLVVNRYMDAADVQARLVSWSLDHYRVQAGMGNGITVPGDATTGSPYAAPATLTPSTHVDFYDEEVEEDGPLSAYVLTRLNRNLNALWEYVTGAKVPGNAAYQTTTTRDHSRASFTSEALLDFPLTILALGGTRSATGKPSISPYTGAATDGMTGWTRYPTTHLAAGTAFSTAHIQCPSFSTSSSRLKCAILIHTPNATSDATNWRYDVSSSAGTATAVASTQIGTSNLHVAIVDAIPFTADADNVLSARVRYNGGAGTAVTDEIEILGLVYYFD